jgi:hypothetical protein
VRSGEKEADEDELEDSLLKLAAKEHEHLIDYKHERDAT